MDKYVLTVMMPIFNQPKLFKRGLDSIPADSRVEIIICDDGSTDTSWANLCAYCDEHPDKNITLLHFDDNRGVASAVNECMDAAQGKYIVILASDGDYFMPGFVSRALDTWLTQNHDLVYFNIIDNNKHIRLLTPDTTKKYVGSVKFMKRSFVANLRYPVERRRAEDVVFTQQILAKHPKEFFTNTIGKYYNYPRVGSLTWNARHGITDGIGNPLQ